MERGEVPKANEERTHQEAQQQDDKGHEQSQELLRNRPEHNIRQFSRDAVSQQSTHSDKNWSVSILKDAAQDFSGETSGQKQSHTELLWVGSVDGMEKTLVERADIAYIGIETDKIRGIHPWRALRSCGRMVKGLGQALKLIKQFRPTVCLATGGYVCVPVVFACWLHRVPVLIYLPDMALGWTIRFLSYFVQHVAVSLPGAAVHFGGEAPQGKAVVTGYPVRAELISAAKNRHEARTQLFRRLHTPQMDDNGVLQKTEETIYESEIPLVLIWGGSQGARSINQATWQGLAKIVLHAIVLHVIGKRDWPIYQELIQRQALDLPEEFSRRYYPVAYLYDEMALALAAADLSVARAGASTLGEFPIAQLPSILIPLPFAGVNQIQNAQELTKQNAAVIVQDSRLSEVLIPTVLDLLHNTDQLQAMKKSLAQLAKPNAAMNIAQLLVDQQKLVVHR